MSKIALLNDAFRTTLSGGTVLLSAGVYELPDMVKAAAIRRVATFDAFTEDNDPYGEHDFGSFDLCGRRFFWKIDYFDERRRVRLRRSGRPAENDPHPHDHACERILKCASKQTVGASTPSPTIPSSARAGAGSTVARRASATRTR